MKLTLRLLFAVLIALALPVQAEQKNHNADSGTMSYKECVENMENCPEDKADECRANLKEQGGCHFKKDQKFKHKYSADRKKIPQTKGEKNKLLTPDECKQIVEQCPEDKAKECQEKLKFQGCVFSKDQVFQHKAPNHDFSEQPELCVKMVEECLSQVDPLSLDQCKANATEEFKCIFTPDQKFEATNQSITPAECIAGMESCPEAGRTQCRKTLEEMGCAFSSEQNFTYKDQAYKHEPSSYQDCVKFMEGCLEQDSSNLEECKLKAKEIECLFEPNQVFQPRSPELTVLDEKHCNEALQQCPKGANIEQCKMSLNENGCTFKLKATSENTMSSLDSDNVQVSNKKPENLKPEDCIRVMSTCPKYLSNQCKRDLEQAGCQFSSEPDESASSDPIKQNTIDKYKNANADTVSRELSDTELEGIINTMQITSLSPEECEKAKKTCTRSPASCKKLLEKMNCPSQ